MGNGTTDGDFGRGESSDSLPTSLPLMVRRPREALMLRYFADLDPPEIARAMGISRGTVKSTTSRALRALGRYLDPPPGEGAHERAGCR